MLACTPLWRHVCRTATRRACALMHKWHAEAPAHAQASTCRCKRSCKYVRRLQLDSSCMHSYAIQARAAHECCCAATAHDNMHLHPPATHTDAGMHARAHHQAHRRMCASTTVARAPICKHSHSVWLTVTGLSLICLQLSALRFKRPP
jgi:hypothetical protein